MSKMGKTILEVQQMVDQGIKYNESYDKIMSDISHFHGDMFTAIAEEYYYDQDEPMYEEIHDVNQYEELLNELDQMGELK